MPQGATLSPLTDFEILMPGPAPGILFSVAGRRAENRGTLSDARLDAAVAGLAADLPRAASGGRAGRGHRFLPRQAGQYHRRLVGRRRLRHLRAAHCAAPRRAYSRQSRSRGAEHAGRRQQQGDRLRLFGGAQGRHHDRPIFPGAILDPLIGDVQVQHDPSKFNYLGSANADIYICFVPATPRRRRSRMFSATRSSSAPAIPAARRAICRR